MRKVPSELGRLMFSGSNRSSSRKALPVRVSHMFTPQSAVFDEDNLVSCAGLVPVMALAEQAGLSELLANKIHIAAPRVKSGSANPAPKLATLIAGMCAGADYIDDVDLVRAGGMKSLFHRVYAPSTVGTLLREFTFGHARQLDSVLAEHLAGLCERVNLLRGAHGRPGDHHRPRGRGERADHRARRQRLRLPRRATYLPPIWCGVLAGADPQQCGATRHQRDSRARLDTRSISRCGARSRYRGLHL